MPFIPLGTLTGNVAPTTNRYEELQVARLTLTDTLTFSGGATLKNLLILDPTSGYQTLNQDTSGGGLGVVWEDNWWRYRFGTNATPRGIRIDNYDTVGMSFDRLGIITVEGSGTITLKNGNNKIQATETDDTVNWSLGNSTGTDNLLIDSLRPGYGIYLRAADSGGTLLNRVFIDGDGDTLLYDDTAKVAIRIQTNAETDVVRFYNADGTTVSQQFFSDGSIKGRHPDSAALSEFWPSGVIRNAGTHEGALKSMTSTETSLYSQNFTVTANEPVVVFLWWKVRIESAVGQYYWARGYIGGSEMEVNGGYPSIIDPDIANQNTNHTHTGPSHTHTGPSHTHSHTTTHRHQGAADVDVYGTSSSYTGSPTHSHASGTYTADTSVLLTTWVSPSTSDAGGTGNTGSGGTGATGSNSASHDHNPGGYHMLYGMAYRSYTPTGSTVACAIHGRVQTTTVNVRTAMMVMIYRT